MRSSSSNDLFSNRFETYDLHREVCTLLLVLFSTQMYRELPLGPDSIVPEDPQQHQQQHQQHTNEEGKGKEKEKEEEPGTGREKEARKDTQSTTTTTTTPPQLQQQHNQDEENLFADIAQQYHRIPQFMNKLLHNFVEQREKPPRMDPASLFKTIGTAASMSHSLHIFSLLPNIRSLSCALSLSLPQLKLIL
jgi:hypothetical protein